MGSAGASADLAPLDIVAADGVSGRLTQVGFLSDLGEGRRNLIQVDWEIPAGVEVYLCGRSTVTDEVYLSAFYPLSPAGTHHTALTVDDRPELPDGVTQCDVSEVGRRNVFGTGVGSLGGALPQGIAMKLERGTQLLLNLHLFNFTDAPLRGRSGTLAAPTPAAAVRALADGLAAGPLKLSVPPGRSVLNGVCTVDRDYTIFSVLPHMHQVGVHMKVVARRALGAELLLHDGPYDFEHQVSYGFEPLELKAGDSIAVECTYENTTGVTKHFGESSNDEMCIAGLARYPAGGKSACPF